MARGSEMGNRDGVGALASIESYLKHSGVESGNTQEGSYLIAM